MPNTSHSYSEYPSLFANTANYCELPGNGIPLANDRCEQRFISAESDNPDELDHFDDDFCDVDGLDELDHFDDDFRDIDELNDDLLLSPSDSHKR